MITIVEAFQIPIKLNLDEDAKNFVKRLREAGKDIGGTISSGARDLGGGKTGGGGLGEAFQDSVKNTKEAAKKTGGLLTGILGKVGIAAGGIGLLISALNTFDVLVNVVKQIVKVLFEFLRPVVDVVLLLLGPILQMLKPILQVARQIMAPFRQLAFSLSRQAVQAGKEGDTIAAAGLFQLSFQAILSGVSATMTFFSKGILDQIIDLSLFLVKQISGVLIAMITPILAMFGINTGEVIDGVNDFIDSGAKLIKDAMGFGIATIFSVETLGISKAAEILGADVSTEYQKINDMLGEVFVGGGSSFKTTFDEMTASFENTLIGLDDVLLGPDGIVSKFQKAADQINNINVRGSGGGGRTGFGVFGGAAGGRPITRSNQFVNPLTSGGGIGL